MTLWSYIRSTDISYLRITTMTLNEYLSLCLFSQIVGVLKAKHLEPTTENVVNCYDNNFFYTPRIYCKDGFNISIQINNGNYCSSENGYREFGLKWEGVEWGYPSKLLRNSKRYCHETPGTTQTVGIDVPIDVMDELLVSHGGIDVTRSIEQFIEQYNKHS